MSTKGFFLLVIMVAIWGGAIGGAFAGGVAFGRGQQQAAPDTGLLGGLSQGQIQQIQSLAGGAPPSGQGFGRPADRLALQQPTPEEPESATNQPAEAEQQAAPAGQGGGLRLPGGGSPVLNGTILAVSDGSITIDTGGGEAIVTVGDATRFMRFQESDLVSLEEGEAVMVITGPGSADGNQAATLVIVNLPQGELLPFGRGAFGGGPPAPGAGRE